MTRQQGGSQKKRLVPAVVRSIQILDALRLADGPLSAADIATRTGLPRTTVHEIVHTLAHYSYLVSSPENPHAYKLGPALLSLGYKYEANLDIAREGQIVAREISRISGETVQVATLHGREVLYVAKVDSPSHVRLVSYVGGRLPAHVTAVGKALLAHVPLPTLNQLIPEDETLVGLTPQSVTNRKQLFEQLAEIRESGLAIEHRESNPDVGCIAAPVRDYTGTVIAALSISALMTRFTNEETTRRAELVRSGALDLSRRLGWTEA